ncbi:MAG: SUMF1/EgtB/PvdO family nonheme iron enzyme [Bacteroidia bacterium]|nr:SUMF1/EgtB/PvdO family nonheme iron enzyme [Bacteroidia bacterium]
MKIGTNGTIMGFRLKIIQLSLLLFIIPIYCFTQETDKFSGTVKINKYTYIDRTEIDVASWLSYYTYVLQYDGFFAAQKVLPDSNSVEPEVWAYINNKTIEFNDWQGQYTGQPIGYFNKKCTGGEKYGSPLYIPSSYCTLLSLPITGITYEQAVAFCAWRTKVLGKKMVTYRLPAPEEWKNFALKGFSEAEKSNGFRDSLQKKRNCVGANYNFKYSNLIGKHYCVSQFHRDKNKANDVFGNVSEMTSVKGIAKGGNYKLYANQCHPDSVQHYSKPEKWLGFRCIAIINSNEIQSEKISNNEVKDNNGKKNNTLSAIIWDGRFGEFSDKRDGKNYRVVKIGEQIWIAQNLAYKPTEGKYWAYKNNEENVARFGYLYTWETAKTVCPTGWHLPKKSEFEILFNNLGGIDTVAFKELLPRGNSGFSALSAGLRLGINYTQLETGTAFWASSENGKKRAWGLTVGRLQPNAYVDDGWFKDSGLYVRCIKDK